MDRINHLWHSQFVERWREIAKAYDKFCITREVADFDIANMLHKELNYEYEMSLDLLDFVELGRALPCKQTLHNIKSNLYE